MAMRLRRAGIGAVGVFLEDDSGVLQLLSQERGIETYPWRGPRPSSRLPERRAGRGQSGNRVRETKVNVWAASGTLPRSVFLSGSQRSPPTIDGFIIGLFEKRFSFTLKGDIRAAGRERKRLFVFASRSVSGRSPVSCLLAPQEHGSSSLHGDERLPEPRADPLNPRNLDDNDSGPSMGHAP
ncbi:hypothetical protein EYF80_001828 [Liparis tanakae]|uniref:Uncharacterized protein n=1 Tax=Liparis tanakae TaxID=230148 RepID=A0A4Z2JDE8_9TELE|nr:hypothetical protein EYF80_001828 [Liparis tanakae]